jgi:hypothetical protein
LFLHRKVAPDHGQRRGPYPGHEELRPEVWELRENLTEAANWISDQLDERERQQGSVRQARRRFAGSHRFASVRFARPRFARPRFARVKFAPVRFAPVRFSPVRLAPVRSARPRLAPVRFALVRFAPVSFAPFRSALCTILIH